MNALYRFLIWFTSFVAAQMRFTRGEGVALYECPGVESGLGCAGCGWVRDPSRLRVLEQGWAAGLMMARVMGTRQTAVFCDVGCGMRMGMWAAGLWVGR